MRSNIIPVIPAMASHHSLVKFLPLKSTENLEVVKVCISHEWTISGGFRSVEDAQMFGRIRGYISTLKKQGLNLLEALKQVFLGNPAIPQPE